MLRSNMWQALNLLVWGCIFLIAFLSILDFIILPINYTELSILKIGGLTLIILSHYILKNILKDPTILLHIILLTLMLVYFISISLTNINGQILNLVAIGITFTAFNAIAVWRVSDAVVQFILLCCIFFLLDYNGNINLEDLLLRGGYTSLAICALSVCFPAIRVLGLKDRVEKGMEDNEAYGEIKQSNFRLEQSIRYKSNQIKSYNNNAKLLRHDLKNMLGSIGSLTELIEMEERYINNPGQQDYLQLIRDTADQLMDSTDKLFKPFDLEDNTSQGEAVEMSLESLEGIVSKSKYRLSDNFYSKNINIQIDFPLDKPIVYVDKNLAEIAIFNLLKYAINFSNNNDTITISCTSEHGFINLIIYNKTSGISMVELESYFKNIDDYKLKEVQQSKGLGLSIAKSHIEAMNSRLFYSSSLALGFEFLIEFKMKEIAN